MLSPVGSKTQEATPLPEPVNSGLSQSLEEVINRLSQDTLRKAYTSSHSTSPSPFSKPTSIPTVHGGITSLSSLSSGHLVVGSRSDTLPILDISTGEHLETLQGQDKRTSGLVALSLDQVIRASDDSPSIRFFRTSERGPHTFTGHKSSVSSLTLFSPTHLASVGLNEPILLWDIHTGKCLPSLQDNVEGATSLASLSGNLVVASVDGLVRILHPSTGKWVQSFKGSRSPSNALAILDPDTIASTEDKAIHIWSTRTGRRLRTLEGHELHITSLLSPFSPHLISASADKTVRVWNTLTGKCIKVLHMGSRIGALGMLLSGDIGIGMSDGTFQTLSWRKEGTELIFQKEFRRRGLEQGGKEHKGSASLSSSPASLASSLSSLSLSDSPSSTAFSSSPPSRSSSPQKKRPDLPEEESFQPLSLVQQKEE